MKLWRIGLIICLLSAPLSLSNSITSVKATSLVTLLPIADAYVDSEHTTSNYGGADYLYARFWDYTYIADVRENSYLMFNLTRFSPSSEMSSASLRLYAWSAWSPTAHVGVHQCSGTAWNEITINWLNAPSFSPSASDIVAVPLEYTWYSWNVTSLVNNALGSMLTLVLSVEDIGDSYSTAFYSKEGWQNNPELVIEFKDGEPPTYANFHLPKDVVKASEDFIVSVELYDPSGISEARAVLLDKQQNDMGNILWRVQEEMEHTARLCILTQQQLMVSIPLKFTQRMELEMTDGQTFWERLCLITCRLLYRFFHQIIEHIQ